MLTYTISTDFPNGTVDRKSFVAELQAAPLSSELLATLAVDINPGADRVDVDGDIQAGDQAAVDTVVGSHQGVPFELGPISVNVPGEQTTTLPQPGSSTAQLVKDATPTTRCRPSSMSVRTTPVAFALPALVTRMV